MRVALAAAVAGLLLHASASAGQQAVSSEQLDYLLAKLSEQQAQLSVLQKTVGELNERVARLEREARELRQLPSQSQASPQRAIPASLDAWRRLEEGMTREQVRSLLGEPLRIVKPHFEYWYYGSGECPNVKFSSSEVVGWCEPEWTSR